MQLENGSEDDSWLCNYCDKSNTDRENGKKVAAWRCTADFRNSKEKTTRNGCDYDICSDCIKEYRVSFRVQQSDNLLLAEEASRFYQSQIQCSKDKRVRDVFIICLDLDYFTSCNFTFRILSFIKRVWSGAENEVPDSIRNEIR